MAEHPEMAEEKSDDHRLKSLFDSTDSAEAYVQGFNQLMAQRVSEIDAAAVAAVVDALAAAFERGATVYVMANGGSAAVASHFVNDMGVNALVEGKPGCAVVSLTDNVESVTAVANDSGYENIFLYQLQCQIQPGDVVLAMSVSGNSENILRGVEYANENGAETIGFCGFDGGELRDTAQLTVHIPTTTDEYGPVEDIFSVLCHIVSGYIAMRRGRVLYHSVSW